jgi:two-component system, cell cycle sensor histidine kinase and response regulator CckA
MTAKHEDEQSLRAELEAARAHVAELEDRLQRQAVASQRAAGRMDQLNRTLRAIRDVNQLITQEADRDLLLHRACALLVEGRGFYNAWIALVDGGRPVEPFYHAGFDGGPDDGFAPMAEQLRAGALPACARTCLGAGGVHIIADPPAACGDCPLAAGYRGRGALIARLERGKRVFGWLSASVPQALVGEAEEQSLFAEVCGDLAFALHNIEVAQQSRRSLHRYQDLFMQVALGIFVADEEFEIVDANRAAAAMLGTRREELIGLRAADLLHPEDLQLHSPGETSTKAQREGLVRVERRYRTENGAYLPVEVTVSRVRGEAGENLHLVMFSDITALKEAERSQRKLQQQIQRAQRMESIGRLAGGVAHDFNNLLTIILSSCTFLEDDLRPDDPVIEDVGHIADAGRRAMALTRQLLAFSRRQTMRPELVDINRAVADLEKMLRRLIGEDIELLVRPAEPLWPVEIDPGQLEQVVINLAVNSRDAMPAGGRLTIETAKAALDAEYAAAHAGVEPGDYVLLAVSDDGVGMDAATRDQIFEPFFTTKGEERGTGLGLATAYGIIKQCGGEIWVYSEPGRGSTFKIYLPRSHSAPKGRTAAPPPAARASGPETVLVVEDEAPVRKLAVRILERQGYRVLQARDGLEAETVAREFDDRIDLLLSDVVMPGRSGAETAERLTAARPELRVLYMSGYTDNAIMHHGVLDPGIRLVEKPFTVDKLASAVRAALDDAD